MKRISDRIYGIKMIFAQAPEEPEQLQSASGGSQLIISVCRTIRFVPFIRKGTKIQEIQSILSKKVLNLKMLN
jgi:hypothetical protein